MNTAETAYAYEQKERAGSPRSAGAHAGWSRRGYLPHYDAAGEVQHIVFRLNDALPLRDLARLREAQLNDRFEAAEDVLDRGFGQSMLSDPRIATVMVETLLKFDLERYRMLAWCIMPNHVHVLIEQFSGWPLGSILHSWKSFTAGRANRLMLRDGRFWAADYFDRAMRNEDQTARAADYIELNPVAAGLCAAATDWPWSSAGCRTD